MARIASRAHGVVTRQELLAAGLSAQQIKHRLRIGMLIEEYRGVYRAGHRAPSVEAGYMAAVKACGARAVLSGRAAAHLLGISRGKPPPPEVTAPTGRRVKRVPTRRIRLDRHDVTKWRGIPVTAPARTLVDLAAVVDADTLARACHEAGIRHGTTPKQVEAALSHRPNAPGAGRLRRVLRGDVPVTLSKLEARFLGLLRDAGLALPRTNRLIGERRVDCHWPNHGLIVELDSYRYHSSRHAWEQDRRREREARARGQEFRRYTYGDVFEDPALMLAELRALIGR